MTPVPIDTDAALKRFLTLAAIDGISGKERAVMNQIIATMTTPTRGVISAAKSVI